MTRPDLKQWASAPASWITSDGDTLGETVLSSRVRIARNLSTFPFPHNSSANLQKQALEQIAPVFQKAPTLKNSSTFDINGFNQLEKAFLMERQLVSRDHAQTEGEKGLIVASGESISVMINEEDHIRAASFKAGLALTEAWETLSRLDEDPAVPHSIPVDERNRMCSVSLACSFHVAPSRT